MGRRRAAVSENLAAGLAGGSECVLWQFYIESDGYAKVSHNNKKIKVHRMVWFMAGREIPQGYSVDHSCHDPRYCTGGVQCLHRRCINIDHLRLATQKEQMLNSTNSRKRGFCKNGHLWTKENTYVSPSDKRVQCRSCRNKRDKDKYLKCIQ